MEGPTFSGLVVINGKTNKYERKIDLRSHGMSNIDLSNISVSRLRKVFVANGLELNNESIFCVNDVDDSYVEQIYMPNINGAPVTRVTGTIVDNVRDILYAVCVADGEGDGDFSEHSIVYGFDIANKYKLIASSPVMDQELLMPVLNLEKRVLYLVAFPSQNGGAGKVISRLVSLSLEKMDFVNSVELPEAIIESAVHLARSGRVGLTTTRFSGAYPRPAFFIVDNPEVP